jgi:zinc transport system permease protein
MMADLLQYEFMRNALLASVLVSIACGIIGTFVVVKRIVFISGGIAHAAYGGIGLGYYLGFNPSLGAVGFSLAAAAGISVIQHKARERTDTLIGVLWAVGMAVGIALIDLTPGYAADLMSYLFGSILTVPTFDIWMMIVLDAVILVVVMLLYKELVAISVDEEFATIIGIPVERLQLVLLCLIALTVVMLMRVVGLILIIALLTLPPAIASQFTDNLRKTMLVAIVLSILFSLVGLWLSDAIDLTSGAAITLVSGVCYLLSLVIKSVHNSLTLRRQ